MGRTKKKERLFVDDRVIVTRKRSVQWLEDRNRAINGVIVEKDNEHLRSWTKCPWKVLFDDGHDSWWARWEIDKV